MLPRCLCDGGAAQVDDKYQYSCENYECRVHGWISPDSLVGFWTITPSNEFQSNGPLKQDLTSHVGPTTLSVCAIFLPFPLFISFIKIVYRLLGTKSVWLHGKVFSNWNYLANDS